MGGELLVTVVALVGALSMLLLVIAIAVGRQRTYPSVALTLSAVLAGYYTADVQNAQMISFFMLFAVLSLPIALATYLIKRLVVVLKEPRGT